MGRPRERNKDLPPFMHRKDDGRFYYWGPPMVEGKRTYHAIEAREREKAIDEYWLYRKANDVAGDGTFGAIIDAYLTHPYDGLADSKITSEATREGYRAMAPILRKLWGDKRYALTDLQALKGAGVYLRPSVFADFLREHQGKRGAVAANRKVALASAMFKFAIRRDLTAYNPAAAVTRNTETPRKVRPDRDTLAKIIAVSKAPMALMIELASVTSISQGDLRLMTRQQVGELLDMSRRKTGVAQEWEITPYVRAIFDRAEKLPGRHKSMFVFPRANGQAYTAKQFKHAFRYARDKIGGAAFTFMDIRKWNIQQAQADGQDAQAFAAHATRQTTDLHYLNNVKRAKPLK